MKKINDDLLDVSDQMVYLYDGKPFTGVGVEESDGRLISETHYLDGMQHGTSKEWFPSGALNIETEFVKSVRHGVSREWFDTGEQQSYTLYEFGIVVEQKVWSEKGELLKDYKLLESDPGFELLELRRKASASTLQ
ncbi:hypothetical protein L1D59_07490 [Pseudoalteromonas piscicida]|uniref:toxin-antitoxin system YwqK family antitoxin n=1 Tax=Pseudoalteromonas piscicida TaxID=43662 RepID=UPI001EFDECE4|nr:hypothetical protein [Pseudoalteromonas piscicida]MCG9768450.1 hypothetical protein [Pseudoalteromonas piscicida]